MSNKIRDIIVTVIFVAIIIGVAVINVIKKDDDISYSERRKLKQFPNITSEKVITGSFSNELEDYAMDQFIFRDKLRSIKTIVKLDILKQKENNGLFVVDNNIYKNIYPLDEKSVLNASNKINNIYTKYLENNTNIYYTIVPDKNYFLEDSKNYLKIDYNKLNSLLEQNISSNIKYIDIYSELSKESYYSTDTHWKQEKIIGVANKIAAEMGFKDNIKTEFNIKEYGEFYGTFYGQLGKKLAPDNISYCTNDIIEKATTYNYETGKETSIYDIEKANKSMDKYDLFLSGATPLIEIRNENATTDKEMIIFRDSFGSSISPLFTEAYSKITLIDIRYIATDLIKDYINFNNQDILFIYSTLLINDSGSLK